MRIQMEKTGNVGILILTIGSTESRPRHSRAGVIERDRKMYLLYPDGLETRRNWIRRMLVRDPGKLSRGESRGYWISDRVSPACLFAQRWTRARHRKQNPVPEGWYTIARAKVFYRRRTWLKISIKSTLLRASTLFYRLALATRQFYFPSWLCFF